MKSYNAISMDITQSMVTTGDAVVEMRGPSILDVKKSHEEKLFEYAKNVSIAEPHFLEFRLLQRLNLAQIQNELAKCKGQILAGSSVSEKELKELRVILHEYVAAIKDFETFKSLGYITGSQAKQRHADLTEAFPDIAGLPGAPFNSLYRCPKSTSMTPTDPLRNFLKANLPQSVTYTKSEMRDHIDEYLAGNPPQSVSPFVDKLSRFLIAFAGGAALVVPMVIMTIDKSVTKSLITVSLAVLLIAIFVSLGIRASNMETVLATATYAAVLVVFVGTGGS